MKIILVDAYNAFVTKDWINKEMQGILDSFPNRKIILTNADSVKQKELWLVNLPYELFTLNFNPKKTEWGYFEKMLKHFWFNANEVIFFEHNLMAVEKAREAWIKTLYYDNNKKDLKELEKFLKDNIV